MPNGSLCSCPRALPCPVVVRGGRAFRTLAGPVLGVALAGGLMLAGCGHRSAPTGAGESVRDTSATSVPPTTATHPSGRASSATVRARPLAARARAASRAKATTTPAAVARVPVTPAYIPFSAKRKAETASYARRHYGVATWHLRPSMIVLHFTETTTMSAARNTFAQDVPNTGELPGTCAHYIVDRDGRVYAIVPVTTICRHTIGLNDKAIGIEMVQSTGGHSAHWADQQILARRAQITSVLRLVRQLQRQWSIPASRVIGHAMANGAPGFHDLEGWRNDHSDWQLVDVLEVRRRLAHP